LEGEKLADFTDERRKVGRPARLWRLTPKAYDRFPDCHAELAVGMLQAIQRAFGEEGLERLTEERTRQQAEAYQALMPGPNASLEERVATLARIRREEGYMAELRHNHDETIELVQNHCSIAKAARLCPKLCGGELSLFRTVLGDDVSVERTEHILSGQDAAPTASPANPTNRRWTEPRSPRAAPDRSRLVAESVALRGTAKRYVFEEEKTN
jgi:predicted ArsR family transcriptional regulator